MSIFYERWILTIVFIFLIFGSISTLVELKKRTEVNSLKEKAIIKKSQFDDELEYLRIRLEMEKERVEVKERELLMLQQGFTSTPEELSIEPNYPYPTAPKEWDAFQKELHIVVPPRLVG